jgi:hypothetical protein
VHQKIVQEILGDAQIMLTLGTYSHVLPEAQAEVVKAVNGLLGGCARRNLMKSESLRTRNYWVTPELIVIRSAKLASNGLRRAASLFPHSPLKT